MSEFSKQIIAEAIDYLVAHHDQSPSLDHLAKRAGYETTHFQKLFKDKVGISPKRLLQYMNMRRARQLMQDGLGLHDTAHETGLSGTGRLHDLFVSCEAVTPGEVKNRGSGLKITYGFASTILGEMLVSQTERGVCYLGFVVDEKRDIPIEKMKAHFPLASFVHDDGAIGKAAADIMRIWHGDKTGKVRLDLYGTNLQIQVWQALLKIPTGETLTYGDIANDLGRPKAARAVGNAVGANPISLLIPCHRVIRSTGIIDNYGWGSPRKKLILGMEGLL